jgi:hypothetical protein
MLADDLLQPVPPVAPAVPVGPVFHKEGDRRAEAGFQVADKPQSESGVGEVAKI